MTDDGVKVCGWCLGEASRHGNECRHCAATGFTEDLRPYGYCEGHYMSRCDTCGHTNYEVDKRARLCRPCALQVREDVMKTKTAPPPSPEHVTAASTTSFMREMVQVAEAFGRAGAEGPFTVGLPQLLQGWVAEKNGYRKISILAGAQFEIGKVTIGKKAGILFHFRPVGVAKTTEKDHPEWVELNWDDLVNAFGDLSEAIDRDLVLRNQPQVSVVNDKLKDAIGRNPAMHKVLLEGFTLAVDRGRQAANDDKHARVPGWGAF